MTGAFGWWRLRPPLDRRKKEFGREADRGKAEVSSGETVADGTFFLSPGPKRKCEGEVLMTVSSDTGGEQAACEVPLGLLELDSDGTVLYHKAEQGQPGVGAGLAGRNLFAELRCAENVGEFRRILHAFAAGRAPAHSFDFTFRTGSGPFPVRVLLARLHEQAEGGERELSLVHIRRA